MATARELLDTYRTNLFPQYPIVAVEPSITADEMRKSKPALFLAIVAAAASQESAELSAVLDQEVLQQYATRCLIRSEKSLELVHALLVSAVWYHPPSKFGQLKYYEYIHMAASMAVDLGIGSKPLPRRGRFRSGESGTHVGSIPSVHPAEDIANPDLSMTPRPALSMPETASLESRRTLLACYMVCAGVAVSLKRHNMMRASSYIRECVEFMDHAPNALPSDRTIVAWTRLCFIAEEINASFSYDDPGGIATIADLRTRLMLKDFGKRLADWRASVPEPGVSGALTIVYYTTQLYLHEIALHVDHSPEDFKAPYQMGSVHSSDGCEVPTQALANSVAALIYNSHDMLDAFQAMDPARLRGLPVFSFVRVSFSLFILAKLCLSASNPTSRIGRVLDRSSLKIDAYMDRTILHVRNIVGFGAQKSRVPAIFLALLFKLRHWCLHPEMVEQSGFDQTITYPQSKHSNHVHNHNVDPGQPAFVGPRVTEHISSPETSPETLGQDQASDTGRVTEMAVGGSMTRDPANILPISSSECHSLVAGIQPVPVELASDGTPVTDTSSTKADNYHAYQASSTGNLYDQMDLDKDFFDFLGDMNGSLPEGGLTGLDDWASLPTPSSWETVQLNDMHSWHSLP